LAKAEGRHHRSVSLAAYIALAPRSHQIRGAMRPARSVSSKTTPQAFRSAAALFRPKP